jgi:hypothetical protein
VAPAELDGLVTGVTAPVPDLLLVSKEALDDLTAMRPDAIAVDGTLKL